VLRFLAERCGFTVFALESGFSEGLAVDAWVRGGPGDVAALAEHGITHRMGRCPEMREQLSWMRSSPLPLRFSGIDVPGSTASPLPALDNLRRYLSGIDADAVPLVDGIAALAEAYAGEHTLPAYRAYAGIAPADRNRATALLADLATRFDALEAEYTVAGGAAAYRTARRELRLAVLLDQGLRGFAGEHAHPKVAARDRGMAETVLELLGPDLRPPGRSGGTGRGGGLRHRAAAGAGGQRGESLPVVLRPAAGGSARGAGPEARAGTDPAQRGLPGHARPGCLRPGGQHPGDHY
jgi:erythromycin esterase